MDFSRRLNSLQSALERLGLSDEAQLVKLSFPMEIEADIEPYGDMLSAIRQTNKPENIEGRVAIGNRIIAFVLKERFNKILSLFQKHILFCIVPESDSISESKIISDYCIGVAKITREQGDSKWRISFVSLIDDHRGRGYGQEIYSWLSGPFLRDEISKINTENGEITPSALISDSVQTADSKRMWIKLLEKNMLDSERVDPTAIVAFDQAIKQASPIVKKNGERFYDNRQSLKPIWSGDSSSENIVLQFLNQSK